MPVDDPDVLVGTDELSKRYGSVTALDRVSRAVRRGEVAVLAAYVVVAASVGLVVLRRRDVT